MEPQLSKQDGSLSKATKELGCPIKEIQDLLLAANDRETSYDQASDQGSRPLCGPQIICLFSIPTTLTVIFFEIKHSLVGRHCHGTKNEAIFFLDIRTYSLSLFFLRTLLYQ